jgi:hypothetical protein
VSWSQQLELPGDVRSLGSMFGGGGSSMSAEEAHDAHVVAAGTKTPSFSRRDQSPSFTSTHRPLTPRLSSITVIAGAMSSEPQDAKGDGPWDDSTRRKFEK